MKKMYRKLLSATVFFLLSMCFVVAANSADLSPEYLQGRWVIDSQNCSSRDSEYMVFSKNATFVNTRNGKAEIVGFWEISGDVKNVLHLHMVTSPAFFNDLHPELQQYQDIFGYYQTNIITFNLGKKSFEAIGIVGDQMRGMVAVRCK